MTNIDKIKKFIVILSIILININYGINTIYAHESISFKNITINDGLSQGTVHTLLQDKQGRIWIGTDDGLNVYNGYEIKVYKYKENDPNSIANGYILKLAEDKYGNIWVATIGGVSKINLKENKITNYYHGKDKGNLSDNNVYDILVTSDNKILLATSNGIDIYNEKTDQFSSLIEDKKLLSNKHIYEIEEDNQGNLWVGTKSGLNKIDIKTKEVENISILNKGHNDITIYSVFFDNSKYIWIGTMQSGIFRIDIKTKEVKKYIVDKASEEGTTVRDVIIDSRGDIWAASSQGLAKYEKNKDEFTLYKKDIYDANSLCDNMINSIIEDKTGLLWIGTYSGISIFDASNKVKHYKVNPSDPNSIASNMINGIYKDTQGLVWVGTNSEGLSVLDRENDKTYQLNINNGLSSNKVYDIKGKDNIIYISTDKGVNIVDKEAKTIKLYNSNNGLKSENVRTILVDDNNYIWAGTMDGASIINTDTDEIIDLSYIWESLGIYDKLNGCIFKDSNGIYWVGNFIDGGMIKINPQNNEIKHYKNNSKDKNSLSDDVVRVINEDKQGNLWIGTSYGLNKFNPKTEIFKRYTIEDGLPNNTIYGIVIDEYQNIWCSTNNGLAKLNPKTEEFSNFNVIDGLQGSEFNGKSYHISKDHEIFFGGTNGFNSFRANELDKTVKNKPLIIEKITVNEERYKNINNFKFKHNQNNITIEMFLPYYKNTRNNKYLYKIEGIDEDFKDINSNKLTLANLSPGKYTLKLMALNTGAAVTPEESISFTIKQPFWKSTQAIIIYILIIIISIVYYKNKVRILDKIVSNKTKQLEKQMNKNEELFNKIIKLEKRKNSYFINLSHELRTPLNVILSTEQLITSVANKKGISIDSLNHNMDIIKRNSKRLLELITNLMDIEKIEYGKYSIKKEEHDIVQVVEDEVLTLKNHIEFNEIDLVIDPEIEEKIVKFDKKEIKRCIDNLISNAIKFTPKGGQIYVGIKDLGNTVAIIVQDNGVGIDKEYQKTIFDRFSQVVDANEEIQNSSGLGLTITRDIVKLHGGTILLDSELGKGAKFTIVLPVE